MLFLLYKMSYNVKRVMIKRVICVMIRASLIYYSNLAKFKLGINLYLSVSSEIIYS